MYQYIVHFYVGFIWKKERDSVERIESPKQRFIISEYYSYILIYTLGEKEIPREERKSVIAV